MMTALIVLRDALAQIEGVASCKIGIEKNISPADYPAIRILPELLAPGKPYGSTTSETLIHFASDIDEAEEGMEAVYVELFSLRASIIEVLKTQRVRNHQTIAFSTTLPTYKAMWIRCQFEA